MKVLFLNDANGHEFKNPHAALIDIDLGEVVMDFNELTEHMRSLEYNQLGVMRRGGSYQEILNELVKQGFKYKKISEARFSDFKDATKFHYKLISGNY